MNDLGALFRLVRKERGFTLKSLSEGIVSFSYLSKFEKGKTQISMNNLIALLQRMNLTVDEFLYFNQIKMNDYQEFFQKISMAHSQLNLENLKEYLILEQKLYQESDIDFHKYNAIMIAAVIKNIDGDFFISKENIQELVDYILACSFWTTYEIALLGNSLSLFSEDLLVILLEEVKKKILDYQVMRKNIRDLIRLMQNAAILFLRDGKTQPAENILEFLRKTIYSDHYFEKTRQLFIEGLLLLQDEEEKGIQMAQEAIQIMEMIDQPLAKNHRLELEKLTKFYH